MGLHFPFITRALRLAPIFLLLRGCVLLLAPGTRRRTTILHEFGTITFWLYLAAVCYNTVNLRRILRGQFSVGENYNITPFAGIRSVVANGDAVYVALNILGNIVMFAPLGFLLPLLWRRWPGLKVFVVSMLASGAIEGLQLFTGRGADVDDILLNTVGGILGYLGYRALTMRFPGYCAAFRLRAGQASPIGARPVKRGARQAALLTIAVPLGVLAAGAVLLGRLPQVSAPVGSAPLPVRRQAANAEAASHPALFGVNSANLILVSENQVVCEQAADQRIYPASMTKVMTAILALEHMEESPEPVCMREEMFADAYRANLSTAGFLPGEEVSRLDLLYGLLLPSGAECAVALAVDAAGSEEAFVERMNRKAQELGMASTHFTNATGRHQADHYTTASDMALLMQYALENRRFRDIVSTESFQTAPTNLHPQGVALHSTLLGKAQNTTFPGGALLGGKTGYTDEAGQCLASFAEVGGEEYILVTAGARPNDYRVEQLHIEDALAMYRALS